MRSTIPRSHSLAPNWSFAKASTAKSIPIPPSSRMTGTTPTGLGGYLKERKLTRVFLAGLAYDYCVAYSALDARRLGLPVIILRDACRAIDLNGSVAKIDAELADGRRRADRPNHRSFRLSRA